MKTLAPLPPETSVANANTRATRLSWHRRAGVFFSLIFIVVGLTGIFLNHSVRLNLQHRPVETDWLYRWYGMQPEGEPVAYALDHGRFAVGLEGTLHLDDQVIGNLADLRGALSLNQLWVAAGPRQLMVLSFEGEVIERLNTATLPPGEIRTLGRIGESTASYRLVLNMTSGSYVFDANLLNWYPLKEDISRELVSTVPVRDDLRDQVVRAYRGDGLTFYRIMLDVHSGRFFGRFGVWIVDLSAVALGFLTLTGVVYAWRKRNAR